MFKNGLPNLSLFCCISLLCLPLFLSAHIPCVVWSSTFYALCAISILYTVPLLCYSAVALSSFFTPYITFTNNTHYNLQRQQQPMSSLIRVFIDSVHLVHAVFTMPLHADSALLFSTSRVLSLIIIMTL
jgi:hypothetical protein